MASLFSLPFELRREIYSYLLIAGNVCSKEVKLKPRFATSLLRVNKQLSQETLEYFYRENAFSVFWLEVLHPFSIEDIETSMPSSTRVKAFPPPSDKRFPLHARVWYGGSRAGTKPIRLIVPLRELGFLVHLINRQQIGTHKDQLRANISLHFNLQLPFFVTRGVVSEGFLKALHVLRRPKHLQDENGSNSWSLTLHGCFDPRFDLAINEETTEVFSNEGILKFCQLQKSKASDLQQQGFLEDALAHSNFAETLASQGAPDWAYTQDWQDCSVIDALEDITIDALLKKSFCYAKLNNAADAALFLSKAVGKNRNRTPWIFFDSGGFPRDPVFRIGYKLFPIDPFENPILLVRSALDAWQPTTPEESSSKSVAEDHLNQSVRDIESIKSSFQTRWSIYLPDPMAAKEKNRDIAAKGHIEAEEDIEEEDEPGP